MRKLLLYLAAIPVLTFTSCEEYDVTEPLSISSLRTVTVTGDVYAELDKTNSTLEKAPQGLRVTVSVPVSSYSTNNNSGEKYLTTATVDADGKFSINVPVVTNGVSATFSFESFTSSVIEEIGVTDTSRVTSLFELSNRTISGLGSGNSNEIVDLGSLEYQESSTDPNANTFTPSTSITYSGSLSYEYRIRAGVNQPDTSIFNPIPVGTVIRVDITSRDEFGTKEYKETRTIRTTANGEYTMDVPLVRNGTATIELSSTEILQLENIILDERYLYVYDLNITDNLFFVDYEDKEYEYVRGTFIRDLD